LEKSIIFKPRKKSTMSEFQNNLAFAQSLDAKDTLAKFRSQFHIPNYNGKPSIYLTGNSLGAMPKEATNALNVELEDWKEFGVEGHFHARNPWMPYHERFAEPLAEIVGAKPSEVVVMNGLTTNLHLLMVSFYRPSAKRYKIICEAHAFPSDQYALETQVKFHGYDPEDALIEVKPREGEHLIRKEDILQKIEEHKDEVALLMIGGVNYYTGQLFDMEHITKEAQKQGITVGWDLAHAAGNVQLDLHKWGVDFAAWCSYKYMNSGPGSISGVFIHERHHANKELPRFAGWWGHDKAVRFKMEKGFVPIESAEAWQCSNAPIFAMAVHKCSLDIFMEAGMENLIEKSKTMTNYMEYIVKDIVSGFDDCDFEIITPADPSERGCQLSIFVHGRGKDFFDVLTSKGVIADWREPNVVRIAPVPLYNSYEDVYAFGQALKESLAE